MKCNVCGTMNHSFFSGAVLEKYNINYYYCQNCGFIQTEYPHWLEEAYSKPINVSDTGYLVRNLSNVKYLTVFLYMLFGTNGVFLDYAGGYGVFVRLMRDIGFDFTWYDKYTKNLFASGFEWDEKSKVDAITIFETFEHFVEPMTEIQSLLQTSNIVVFSTELYPEPVPRPEDWWYYGLEHGQHISFYSKKTLKYIANKFDVYYYKIGSLHIFSRKKIPNYILLTTKLSKFGVDRLLSKKLTSKTWADYQYISKKVEQN